MRLPCVWRKISQALFFDANQWFARETKLSCRVKAARVWDLWCLLRCCAQHFPVVGRTGWLEAKSQDALPVRARLMIARDDEPDPMPVPPVKEPDVASPALSAFLRGVERRAAVFAQLQVGDETVGMAALAEAMGAFRAVAAHTAFGDWPRRFWSILLASPQLREAEAGGQWPAQFQTLATVGRGPRAALLLRLVANVSEADAAAALGVTRPTYRMALHRALPRDEQGRGDEAAWQELGAAGQQAVREMPPHRLEQLAQLREATLQGVAWMPAAPRTDVEDESRLRPRWLWPVLFLVVVATAAGVALVPRLAGLEQGAEGGPAAIISEVLPAGADPVSGLEGDLALLTHPDFELLAAEPQDAAMRAPSFHAWLVHQIEGLPPGDVVREQREETASDVDDASDEAFDDVP